MIKNFFIKIFFFICYIWMCMEVLIVISDDFFGIIDVVKFVYFFVDYKVCLFLM